MTQLCRDGVGGRKGPPAKPLGQAHLALGDAVADVKRAPQVRVGGGPTLGAKGEGHSSRCKHSLGQRTAIETGSELSGQAAPASPNRVGRKVNARVQGRPLGKVWGENSK